MNKINKLMANMLIRCCYFNTKNSNNDYYAKQKLYLASIRKDTHRCTFAINDKSSLILKLICLINQQKHSNCTFSVTIDEYITNKNGEHYFPLIVYFNFMQLQFSFHIPPYCFEYDIIKKLINKRHLDRWKWKYKMSCGNNNSESFKLMALLTGLTYEI